MIRIKKDFLNKTEVHRIKENDAGTSYMEVNHFCFNKGIIEIVKRKTQKKIICLVWS